MYRVYSENIKKDSAFKTIQSLPIKNQSCIDLCISLSVTFILKYFNKTVLYNKTKLLITCHTNFKKKNITVK